VGKRGEAGGEKNAWLNLFVFRPVSNNDNARAFGEFFHVHNAAGKALPKTKGIPDITAVDKSAFCPFGIRA
jgi:hypothetical protein